MINRYMRIPTLVFLASIGMAAHAASCPTTTLDPSTALLVGTVGANYSQAFTATNSNALPFNFSITSGLPSASGLGVVSTGATSANLSGTPIQAGSFLVTVTATDTAGCGGGRTYALSIGQASQTIAFTSTAPSDARIDGAPYVPGATASSGLPVTFTIDANSNGVCSLAGSSVSFQAAGTCVINANQPGDANYNAAPQAQQSFAVGRAEQTISFTSTAPIAAVVGGASYSVAASASSGLAVVFSIDPSASAVCSVAGSSVSFQAAGTCVVNANQPGDANYNAAPQAQQSFAVGRAEQTISFTSTAPIAAVVGGASYSVAASASSGLAVVFSIDSSASAVCSVAGSSVSFQAAGTCVVNANQPGDANYDAAPQAQQSFAVGRADQTISFTSTAPIAAVVGGASYSVAASASSGLAVVFSIDPSASAVCSLAGSSVSFQAAGTCVVNANQPGDANYNAAPQAQQSFAVGRAEQTISFTSTAPIAAVVGGASYSVAASASSGLAVVFSIDPSASAVCSVAGSSVSFQAAGTCVVNANQPGDANYNAAPQVQQSFAVGPGSQTISFTSTAPVNAAVNGAPYMVSAVASSGLPVTLTIDASSSAICTISGSSVSFLSAGNCTINANQAGNANYGAAPQVQQGFAVGPGSQVISFTTMAPSTAIVAGATYEVAATASSGLSVAISIDAAAATVCSLSGTTVSFQGAGACVINANQAGDANWNAAPQAQQVFTVGQGVQTISFTSTAPVSAAAGSSYTVTATASSGLPVSFSIDASASAVCSISGSAVSFLGGGTCVINANQPGDVNWAAAVQVQQSFTVSPCITMSVGQVVLNSMPASANFCVVNNDAVAAEYAYLPINTSATTDSSLSVTGSNIQAVTGPPAPRPGADTDALALAPLQAQSAAIDDVHAFESPTAFPGRAHDASDLVSPQAALGGGPLVVGQLIDINASVGSCGVAPSMRKGRVEAVTIAQSVGQPLLFAVQEVVETTPGAADWHPPVAGGFQAVDFRNILDAFVQAPPGSTPVGSSGSTTLLKTGAMNLVTDAFGMPSDVDGNGGIIIFFTKALNELSPPATSGFAPAMFQSRDLFAAASCAGSNEGEILYAALPDPTGSVNSNVRTFSLVYGGAGPALVHHFEHLLNASRRLYFNGASLLEEMWLDEALAWQMQELVFFNASVGLGPRMNIALSNLTTGPSASVRVADFNTYQNPMYGSMRTYFYQLGSGNGSRRLGPLRRQPYTSGSAPTVHENAAPNFSITHAFLRYALDRHNTGDAALLHALVNSNQTGYGNLQAVFGIDPNDWARDFLVAMYADDAVAGLAPQYTTPSWDYRSVYGGLGGFPMAVDPLVNGVAFNFAIGTGGGARYLRFGVASGQSGAIAVTEGGAPPTAAITGAIVRTR